MADEDINRNSGVSFSDIINLNECGLLDPSGMLLNIFVTSGKPDYIASDTLIIFIKSKSEERVEFPLGIQILTRAGRELFNILAHDSSAEYIDAVAKHITTQKTIRKVGKITTSVHKIISVEKTDQGTKFEFEHTPLASYTRE